MLKNTLFGIPIEVDSRMDPEEVGARIRVEALRRDLAPCRCGQSIHFHLSPTDWEALLAGQRVALRPMP